ncbi:MAG: hypothetical protein CM1200mP16_11750 [Nitrospina sp.]|nr:MAG: hypothetical protein CM1200mP16_11750 [Nitrospina sp.]
MEMFLNGPVVGINLIQIQIHTDENYGKNFKVTRGGSFFKRDHGFIKEFTMIPYRNIVPIYARFWDTGFRCALSG